MVYYKVVKAVRILRLFKLFRTSRLRKTSKTYLNDFLEWILKDTVALVFLPSLSIICILLHLCACAWYYVGIQEQSNNGWIDLSNFRDEPMLDLYTISVYFVV